MREFEYRSQLRHSMSLNSFDISYMLINEINVFLIFEKENGSKATKDRCPIFRGNQQRK